MYKGIITGLGGRGRYWAGEVASYKGAELVAFVEPVQANREIAREKLGVDKDAIFESLDEAIKKTKADFVLDVTPPAVHHQIAQKAFKAGLHVLGEKPLSDDFATAKKVAEQGAKAGVKHMITQNYRFASGPRTLRATLDAGKIGQPGQCDVRFYMNWADIPGSHYVNQPYMLINDMMVHHFDLMRCILNTDPVAVTAITWNHPWGWHKGDAAHAIVFECPNGLKITHVSVGCAVGERTNYNGDWRIEGPEGSVSWDQTGMRYAHMHRVAKPVTEEIKPLEVPGGAHAILDEFFAAIDENRQPECSAQDNLKSLAMVFAAIQSAKEGRKVRLDELK